MDNVAEIITALTADKIKIFSIFKNNKGIKLVNNIKTNILTFLNKEKSIL